MIFNDVSNLLENFLPQELSEYRNGEGEAILIAPINFEGFNKFRSVIKEGSWGCDVPLVCRLETLM